MPTPRRESLATASSLSTRTGHAMKLKLSRSALFLLLTGVPLVAGDVFAQQPSAPAKPTATPSATIRQERTPPAQRATDAEYRAYLEKRFADTVDIRLNQPYAGNDNPKQQLDIFLPKKPKNGKPVPVIVMIHGGGWSGGDRKGYMGAAVGLAATGKYAAISVGYRLSGEKIWPAQIHDCKAAIRWIRAHAKELNIDADKIGATGGSAGGHLVTLLGLTAGNKELEGEVGENTATSSAITCVINFCGPSDMAAPLMQGEKAKTDDPAVKGLVGGPLKEKADVVKGTSPLTYVSAKAVPIMTVHGTVDERVNFNNAEKLEAALKQAGTVHYLVPMTGVGHGIPIVPELAKRMQQFWDMYLYGEKSEISTAAIEPTPAKK